MRLIIIASHFDNSAKEVEDYHNTLDISNSSPDFQELYSSIKFLYPKSTIITFKIA